MLKDKNKKKMRRSFAYASVIVTAVILICIVGSRLFLPAGEGTEPSLGETSDSAFVETQAVSDETGTVTEPEMEMTDSPGDPGEAKEEEQHEESEIPPSKMTVLMVGDILLHTRVEDSARREDGSYNFDAVFANLADKIQAADLAIVNQEVIIGGEELKITGYPNFNAPYEIGDALVKAGFDVICHATNHALDRHEQGIFNTLNFWRENYPDIGVLGIYDSAEAQNEIYTYEANGITVAILNYTYGTNGIPFPEGMPYAVNLLNEDQIISDLARAEEIADFTVVIPHWGTEYLLAADNKQKMWAKTFLDNGADLVLGAHPHVIEPVEWMTDETENREMLVYYSLGNFVNWTSEYKAGVADRMVGGMAEVTLIRNGDGKVVIDRYGIEPVVCHVAAGQDAVTVYPLSGYTEELAAQNEILLQDPDFSLSYCEELCGRVWEELYK